MAAPHRHRVLQLYRSILKVTHRLIVRLALALSFSPSVYPVVLLLERLNVTGRNSAEAGR
jgi:hypothetical protein